MGVCTGSSFSKVTACVRRSTSAPCSNTRHLPGPGGGGVGGRQGEVAGGGRRTDGERGGGGGRGRGGN
eukprot:2994791-Pyramimonas_sp.AAC.1